MAYDEMGNYGGFDESYSQPVNPYDFDEEEKRKEELKRQLEEQQRKSSELASEVSHKQEVTTYGDGSRTVKSTQEIPAGNRVQPVAPTDYNASIAQQESGGNPNIGYHDPSKSSAYGMYGMTNAGYADARRSNPNLPEDIRQATPEQQTAAQDAYTQQNAKYLQNYGIEPTPQTLAAAHFLGAKGLSDYLKTGQISEAAARANGGVENVKRIVDQRLQGQSAPASGAANLVEGEQGGQPTQKPQLQPVSPEQAQQEQPQQEQFTGQGIRAPGQQPGFAPTAGEEGSKNHIEQYQENQNDPQALMKMSTDSNAPDWMKERARNRAADLITQQREMQNAQEKVSSMSESELARAMREKTSGGSWVKAIFYAAIGAKNLAQAEGAKLGLGTDKTVTGSDGKSYMVKVAANGTPLEGYSAETGKKLSAEELVNAVGGGAGPKWQTSAEFFQDKSGNVYQSQHNDKGQVRTVNTKTGAVYSGDEKLERLRDTSKLGQMAQAQEYRRENDTTQFANRIRTLDYDSKLKAVAEAQQAAVNRGEPVFTDTELAQLGVNRPDLNKAPAGGTAQTANRPAPVAPQAQGSSQGAQPVAPVAPQAQGAAPVAPVAPVVPGQRMSVEDMKRQEAEQKLAREGASAVSVDEQKRYNEYVEKDVQPKADAGKMISRVRKEQINGPDGILNNPEIAGLLSGSQGGEVGNIMRDLITGNFKDQTDLSTRVAALNLTDRQKQVLYTQIGLNNQILPQTLKANAGPGAISEAEHKINREANVEITRQPLYSGLTLMTRDQFQKDMQVAKNDFRSANPEIRKTDALNKAWNEQEKRAQEAYDGIYAARAAYIAKHNPNGTNPGAVVDAFRHYPVPTWTGSSWDYGTEFAKKAARKPLGSFNN